MIYTLTILVCLMPGAPGFSDDHDRDCEQVPIPVEMTANQCVIHGQQAAIEWLRQHSYFEFHNLRAWRCEPGERV